MPRLTAANSPLSPAAAAALDLFFATQVPGGPSALMRHGREADFARLYALPDGALRCMGLCREGLAAHLFRDHFSR